LLNDTSTAFNDEAAKAREVFEDDDGNIPDRVEKIGEAAHKAGESMV
jgi:hypothetical protein